MFYFLLPTLVTYDFILVIAAVVLIVRRRKKKKAAEPSIDFDWGDAQEVKTHEHT